MIVTHWSTDAHNFTPPEHWIRLFMGLIEYPMFYMYLNGPQTVGLWAGVDIEEICFVLTGVPSSHWVYNQYQCQILIERQFRAWVIIPYTLLCYLVVWRLVYITWFAIKYTIRRQIQDRNCFIMCNLVI